MDTFPHTTSQFMTDLVTFFAWTLGIWFAVNIAAILGMLIFGRRK